MTTAHDPAETRRFALEVVQRLRSAGHEALWAGGCVRDQLLGLTPKDYDVATSARPEEIREVFGHRRTLAVGAAFGVITVLGKRTACPVEVATFRCDGGYSDGRHPDAVIFSNAEQDAQRRDFTINGLFFDPLAERVHDFVGGQEDLQSGLVRAIRNPYERLAEDKLRMIRAVRFAATFRFELERSTLDAVRQLAGEIVIVSAERIAAEMRRLLPHANRRFGLELLQKTRLLTAILPEAEQLEPESLADHSSPPGAAWQRTLAIVEALHEPTFPVVLAALIRELRPSPIELAVKICQRWRLSTDETNRISWLLQQEALIRGALAAPWPKLQRVLVTDGAAELLTYAEGVARVLDGRTDDIEFCRTRLALPVEQLNPRPLLNGNDLAQLGLAPGPRFRTLLDGLRDAQLLGGVTDRDSAIAWVRAQD